MSLDVYLYTEEAQVQLEQICVRREGRTIKISAEEWNALYPDREPVVLRAVETNCVFSANITHNLNKMAEQAGLYQLLWRPEELSYTTAKQLIAGLQFGLGILRGDPERFKPFNPENGWGTYEGLVEFTGEYLAACQKYPEATIGVSR